MNDRRSGQPGIDIGGTKVAFIARPGPEGGRGAGSWQRELRRCWPSSGGLSADIAALRTWCRQAGSGSIGSVGTSVPATLDPGGRVSTWPNRPHWTGFALADFLRREFPGARVSWGDDGNLAALAEARESGTPDLAYLGVGTGVGGGLVLGGRVIPRLGDGCEIGHMIVAAGGAVCTCGRRGCVQVVASGPATLRRAELASGRRVGADELDDGFARQAEWAIQAVTESAQALACAVVNVAELLR